MSGMSDKKRDRLREEDYQVVQVNRGRRPGGVVSVRLKPDELDLLTALSETHGRTLSETLRVGLHCLARSGGDERLQSGPSTRGQWGDRLVMRSRES